ncbi:ABC transporter permease [Marinicella meishanensis]|uniref:ABC transporter permease n=1 Tax=Marinicella meishanensis TaxID=2873263 RepID=UPI001CC048BA|nr:ABC transporter permease [Marinicella sp. NBU2979]
MSSQRMPITVAGLRLKRLVREKWGLISWLAIPTIIVFLMSLIAGTGSGKLTGKLLITDHDESAVSQLLAGSFNQGPLAEIFTAKQVTEDEGRQLMDAGEASAWITIDAGFGEAFMNNQPGQLRLVKNPAQSILPQMVETSMQLLVDAATYIQILFAEELAVLKPMLETQKFDDANLVALTLGIKQQLERLESTLFPPQLKLIEKQVAEVEETSTNITFGLLMFPGAIIMALIFSANSLAVLIWDDAGNGVIPRLAATPKALQAYSTGQFLGAAAVFTFLTTVLATLGGLYFALPWWQIPAIIVWLVFAGLVLYAMFVFIALLMPTGKVANITISATTFPLLMLGGSFFPMESMPPWLAGIGQFLPNGFLLKGLKDWLLRQEPMMEALWLPAVLGLVMLAAFWLLSRVLVRQLIHKV